MSPPPTAAACEFSPCKTGANSDPRKVISHIFGRNKTVTKRFPPHVWVHYCRQHYQRARYRVSDWAVTQCQLVLVSLARMEEWSSSASGESAGDGDGDGERIRGFRVVLRRRVHWSLRLPGDGDGDGDARAGKRSPNPTSTSPAQSTRKSTLRQTRSTTAAAAAASTTGPAAVQQQESPSTPTPPPTKKASKKPSKKGKKGNKNRKKPTITPNPVPGWLRAETSISAVRSFAEIRDIVGRLKDGLEGARARHSDPESGSGAGSGEVEEGTEGTEGTEKEDLVVRFPDIEILPVFRG